MTQIVFIFLLFCIGIQNISAQSIHKLSSEKLDTILPGRWIEEKRINLNASDSIESIQPYMYVFKENQTFHRGEISEGIIFFDITGQYSIIDDVITIKYMDMINRRPGKVKEKTMIIEVQCLSDNTMNIIFNESRYKKYRLTLQKIQF